LVHLAAHHGIQRPRHDLKPAALEAWLSHGSWSTLLSQPVHSAGDTMQEAKLEARFQMWVARGGRVRLETTERRVRARLGGITVVDSRRAQLLYLPPPFNAYAFPRDDVRWELLHESGIASTMPAVGEVKQWTVAAGGQVRDGAVWTFPQPPPGLAPLGGLAVIR